MLPITGLLGRIANAVLYGVITFVVLFIIGIVVVSFSAEAGEFIKKWAALIGFLTALVVFLRGSSNPVV